MSRNNDDEMPHSAERGTLNKNFAFTLIELLVVIAIIGILSALIIVGMNSTTQKATIAKSQVFANSLRNSLMSNLVSEWKFDNVSGTVGQPLVADAPIPDTWGTNNGAAKSGPTLKNGTDCINGQCLSFDGTDDYVQIDGSNVSTSNLAITGAITLSVWVKFNDAGTHAAITGRGRAFAGNGDNGYFITRYGGDNKIYFDTYSATTRDQFWSSSAITATGWHFVVATWNGTINTNGKKIYIDGVLDNQGTSVISIIGQPNYYFRTGKESNGYYPLNGLIDDVRIYNAAMPTSQIQQNYFTGLNKLFAKNIITQQDYNNRFTELSTNYAKQ
ncbi:MAG: LamG-like jellyroll fold domain-containing protein [Candidatus Paceibacterota bacterium]